MSYLIPADYTKVIQLDYLNQISGNNPQNIANCEALAMETMVEHLTQKYDTASEFTDTLPYSPISAAYKAGSRVYLTAPAYNASSTYAIGVLTLNGGNVYVCSVAITVGEAFNIAHWTLQGILNQLFYAVTPQQTFDIVNGFYNVGDIVFYKGHTYKCLRQTASPDHDAILQYGNTLNIPFNNYFPDDPQNGAANWSDLGIYTIPAGSLLNTVYFTPGDNRSQRAVQVMMDICIYHLHKRISTMNIPELREDAYRDAYRWLKDATLGKDITAKVVRIQPPQGGRIRGGSRIKNVNDY